MRKIGWCTLLPFAGVTLWTVSAWAQAAPAGSGTGVDEPPVHDSSIFVHGLLDQFEGRMSGRSDFRWDGQAWLGTDYNKLWLKSEGVVRGQDGKVEDGRSELLYDRPITTYFDLQAGLRSDLDSKPTRNWAAFGIEGLAPLFFDLEATAYVSDQGHFAGRLQASYDLLITQRLILQPEAELNIYSKADPRRDVGAGISDIDAGLRLRYEISRKFAPYIGVAYEGKFGQTADLSRNAGESTADLRFVFGIRSWF